MQLIRALAVVLALAVSPCIAAPFALAEQAKTPKPAPKTETVFITKTGKKYHQDGCGYLAKSRIEIALADAKKRGHPACAVCYETTARQR